MNEARRKGKGDEKFGYDIVAEALEAPAARIAHNAGVDGDLVVANVREAKGAKGYDAASGEYVDLVKAGIIDPALVATTALSNAASVAGLMLTTDVVLTELKDDTADRRDPLIAFEPLPESGGVIERSRPPTRPDHRPLARIPMTTTAATTRSSRSNAPRRTTRSSGRIGGSP